MSYDAALRRDWDRLLALQPPEGMLFSFLGQAYQLDLTAQSILSRSSGLPVKAFLCIMLLHYLIRRVEGLPPASGEWISFQEVPSGKMYYPAFRKRAIEPIVSAYGRAPEELLEAVKRLPARVDRQGESTIVLEVFEGIEVMIKIWDADQEFGPEATMLFDRNISRIFCTEDVAVLGGFIAHALQPLHI